jgi:hypothetical protein
MNRFWIVPAVALFLSGTWVQAAPMGAAIKAAPVKAAPVRAAPRVEVEWGGSWSLAEVLQTRGHLSLIHYVGWDATWDEWSPRRASGRSAPSTRPQAAATAAARERIIPQPGTAITPSPPPASSVF